MHFARRFMQACCASLLLGTTAIAAPVVLADVQYPQTLKVQGSSVQLNGAGIRYKAVFKVYTAGLYMSRPAGTTQEVYAQAGAKRLAITMLREVDSSELGRLFSRGIGDNIDRAEF